MLMTNFCAAATDSGNAIQKRSGAKEKRSFLLSDLKAENVLPINVLLKINR